MALADFYSSEIRDESTQLAFQSLYAQLRAFLNVSHHEDGSLIPAPPNVGSSPIGAIQAYAGPTAPAKWLLCNGAAVNRVTYQDLFSVIGTAYGTGDGSTTFNLPDLRQRFPLGKAASGTGATLGSTGGAIDHTHSLSGLSVSASGTTSTDGSHSHSGSTGSTGSHSHGGSTGSAGSHTHSNPDVATVASSTGSQGSIPVNFGGDTTVPAYDHIHSQGSTGSGGDHSHSISSDGSHAHSIAADGSHSHTVSVSGSIGAGSTGSANAPFQVVNFIILAGV